MYILVHLCVHVYSSQLVLVHSLILVLVHSLILVLLFSSDDSILAETMIILDHSI